MKKVRIVERTMPDDTIKYVIQQKHFLFWWWWVDAWINNFLGVNCQDSFDTLVLAKRNLCYFDGSVSTERVVY